MLLLNVQSTEILSASSYSINPLQL
jgi:hypothetical protein